MPGVTFPSNPENGMIFEASQDVFYQYSASTNCWKRLPGLKNIGEATINKPGLMTADDLIKLNKLLVPPPQISLTSDDCNTTFDQGLVQLVSNDRDLEINTKLDLVTKDGVKQAGFLIHDNTIGIDFRVNINRIIEELEDRGNLKYLKSNGPIGDIGERGDPGIDELDTGPQGDDGEDGANAQFQGALIEDSNVIVQDTKTRKAVVDIRNDEDNPNKLIVTIGNIGNVDACPNKVNWKNRNSKWIVALSNSGCSFDILSDNCRLRATCQNEIFYLDVSTILDSIKSKFDTVISELKESKEALVNSWIDQLILIFNSQKSAICCAIEAAVSKARNQTIRDTWSGARNALASAGYAFDVNQSGEREPRAEPQIIPSQLYPPNVPGPSQGINITGNYAIIENGNTIINEDLKPENFDCEGCFVQVTLDQTNIGPARSAVLEMPRGSYVATIISCCPEYGSLGSSGGFSVSYISLDDDGEEENKTQTVDLGLFDSDSAQATYTGASLSFKHVGGNVSFFINQVSAFTASGSLTLCIQPTTCFENCETFGFGTDERLTDLSCYMRATHVEFYERGWRTEKACGALVNYMGTKYIVVFRSIGDDVSCGGGEYLETPCIKKFYEGLKGQPQVAVAWPTLDGDEFFGLPRAGNDRGAGDPDAQMLMVLDEQMSNDIVSMINSGNVIKKIGNPKSVITHIIFPSSI